MLRLSIDLTAILASRKDVRVVLERNGNLPQTVIDPTAIEQVFVNFISNAVHASRPGGCVTVRAESQPRGVRVEVRDRGCGMTPEQVDRMFDPLFTTRQNEGGSGLGLSISHRIIEEHEGTVEVRSRLGEGTTVTLNLPLSLSATEEK